MTAPATAIVDIDGTLVDTNYHHVLAWSRAFRRFDLVVRLWWIHQHIGMGGDQLVEAVAGAEAEGWHGEELRQGWTEVFDALVDEIVSVQDLRAKLAETPLRS